MFKLHENSDYVEELHKISTTQLPWEKLKNKSILITGASGLIGSYLIDVLMYMNNNNGLNVNIYGVGRNQELAQERFEKYLKSDFFKFIAADINETVVNFFPKEVDYIIHAASNTHPVAYASDPVGTIATNVIGTKNILDYAIKAQTSKVAFISSVERYGENRGDTELFDEEYVGYINSNTLRAGYPESKRCGEALCQAYIKKYGLNVVIPIVARTFGPTMLKNDSKAISQFIKNACNGENIVLKSEGTQFYSYTYVSDVIMGILYVLLNGQNGEAYNICGEDYDITLRELATLIANYCGTKVVFEIPNATEKEGFSKATKARLDYSKILKLGFKTQYNIETAIKKTIDYLKNE